MQINLAFDDNMRVMLNGPWCVTSGCAAGTYRQIGVRNPIWLFVTHQEFTQQIVYGRCGYHEHHLPPFECLAYVKEYVALATHCD
jgi:hypothetical protein